MDGHKTTRYHMSEEVKQRFFNKGDEFFKFSVERFEFIAMSQNVSGIATSGSIPDL